MAYAFRISDLARTLAQYPTVVTVMGNKIDVRTKEQLATLSSEITALEKLAAEGDAAISAGECENAASLSSRLSSSADQIASTLSAFAAQDNERLKPMSVVSRNKFNAYATDRLQAEKRFADEVAKLLSEEAKAVGALTPETTEPKTSDTKPEPVPDTKPDTKPGPSTRIQPVQEPSLQEVAAALPGYLRATAPAAVSAYDDATLRRECEKSSTAATKLGAKTGQGILDYAIVYFTDGPDTFNASIGSKWASYILADTSLGTVDDRLAILLNASIAERSSPDNDPASLSQPESITPKQED